MRAPDALERSQKKLYLSIKSELSLFEKKKTKDILAYEKTFRACLPRAIRSAEKKEFIRELRRSGVVLVGDFHPFRQSQKGFLRLVEECLPSKKRVVLGLECLQQAHQSAVNEFLAGYITAEELRDKIDFEKYWPFSWENYREILEFAKKKKLPVLALNILERKRNPSMLRERDNAAAEKTAAEIFSHPGTTVFLLYGELHLARRHLPADLRERLGKKIKVAVVHQNEPDLYWKAPKLKNGQKPEVLRLSANEFCVLNSVPWVKLRSYLDWLEGSPTSEDWDEGVDVDGTVHHYARLLADAIGLQATLREDVEIAGPEIFPRNQAALANLSSFDKILLRHSEQFQRTGYLPCSGRLILPAVSTNTLSEAASFLLWHSQRGSSKKAGRPLPYVCVAHFLVGYLGSKVLNPKRKCNEVADLKEMLRGSTRGESRPRVVARALYLLKPYLKGESLPKSQSALSGSAEMEACRLAGYILGDRFFQSLLMAPELLSFVRAWYQCDSAPGMKVLLAETAAKISVVAPARKRDRF